MATNGDVGDLWGNVAGQELGNVVAVEHEVLELDLGDAGFRESAERVDGLVGAPDESSHRAELARNSSRACPGRPNMPCAKRPPASTSSGGPTAWNIIIECSISSGSRSIASQARAITSRLWPYASGVSETQFHSAAYFAAIGMVRFSPPPPIRIGGRPDSGIGRQSARSRL